MAPSAAATQSISSKIKRPVPPGIQTNGIHSSTSSPSPSMSASRLPAGAKFPPNSAPSNGIGSNNTGARSANRRREAPPQLLGRGQRNSSVGLRSASIVGDSAVAQASGPQPYIITDEYILKKYRGNPPSLIIHLHPTHFRFDQQEGSFSYKSPMRIMIEHLRSRTVPHDLLEFFTDVSFYEGCLIVQIHDHKSIAPAQGSTKTIPGTAKTIPFSVHNHNAYLTPSSYVPYPSQSMLAGKGKQAEGDDTAKPKSTEQKDKENMPAPSLPGDGQRRVGGQPKKPQIKTVVLHPTPQCTFVDLASKPTESRSSMDGRRESRQEINVGPLSSSVPPTPTTAIPSTPQTSMAPPAKRVKKTKMQSDSTNIYSKEAHIILATTAPLILEPVNSAGGASALLESLAHPMHAEKPPAPKARKRTVAEMAADEALAADQERYMLTLDERLSSFTAGAQGGSNSTGDGGQAGGASFEPRFERFTVLEGIKHQVEENKKADKLRRDEADRKQRQDQERNKLRDEAEKREQQKLQMQQAAAQRASQQQQELQRRQMAEQAQRSQMSGLPAQGPVAHAHPQSNVNPANGMTAQTQRFHQQQASQTQLSSPTVRTGTPQPQNHSSPSVNNMGNAAMQRSASSMGGSPARPGSVVQNHPQMPAPTSHTMVAQRSQQSHAGTPRLPNSTPNVQSTPLNRQMSQQTNRMGQGSPLQGPMAQTPQMNMNMPMNNAQAQFQQQQRLQQQMLRNQQQQAAQGMGAMMQAGHQLNPQALLQAQMMRSQQAQQQHGMPNQLVQNYAAQMAAMSQRSGGMTPNMNQNFGNGNPGMPNMQQMNAMQMQQLQRQQQMLQIQAQQQAQQAVQQQQHHPQPQAGMNQQQMVQQQIMQQANGIFQRERQKIAGQYPAGIPEEIERQLQQRSQAAATQQVHNIMQQNLRRRQQQAQAQAQMMAAQGMPQNMNGMQNGMGM